MSEKKVEPRRLKGFRDYGPGAMAARWQIMDIVREVAQAAAFQPIATPALEYLDTLLGQGEETEKEIYQFVDHGDRKVALRFDLTVPFSRFVAENQGTLVFPFKKLQIGEAWRGENPQKGRFREFCQCDLDIIGVDSVMADVDVLQCLAQVLHKIDGAFKLGTFTIRIGHRPTLNALMGHFLPNVDGAGRNKLLIAIDKLAKIGQSKVRDLMLLVPGAEASGVDAFLGALTAKVNDGGQDLTSIKSALAGHPESMAGIARLEETVALLKGASAASQKEFVLDLTIARGLGYYTGIVYETVLTELPNFGSISSGGRYNDLVSRFIDRKLEGVGGTIGLDRILAALEERGAVSHDPAVVTPMTHVVYVAIAAPAQRAYALGIVRDLRAAGISVDVALSDGKLGHQFRHASRLGYGYVVTVGESEEKSGTFALKNMATSVEQKDLPRSTVVAKIQST